MKKAGELFEEGYNCAQAVFCAYAEEFGIDFKTGLRLASSFGGGMGRMREVCGAVSAIFMLLGLKEGYILPNNDEIKMKHYSRVQKLAKKFKDEFGSIICRELLNLKNDNISPVPTKRTENFYKERPCKKFVEFASKLVEEEILK